MISNIIGLAAGLEIGKQLGIETGPGKANWIAASYPYDVSAPFSYSHVFLHPHMNIG